jgi:dephospho-CoA kinase
MLIVEAIDATKKRQPIHATDKVVSLGDIAMYTDDEEVPLWQVLENVKAKCEGAACAIDYKKASNEELADFFAEVLPNYDRDRVYMSHVRKLIQWYNLLVSCGLTEFAPVDETEEATEE